MSLNFQVDSKYIPPFHPFEQNMSLTILILGANGFIGSHLIERILKDQPSWKIIGMDIRQNHLEAYLNHPQFTFSLGDITQSEQWIEDAIKNADVALPLAAIATPATYVQDPLKIFSLDFEANLRVIRRCAHYKRRVIFPSTSEVYGMCTDNAFDEETSNLVMGPVQKERWIYACSKQLLDRVIFALGKHEALPFTLFRPFNWVGPRQDDVFEAKDGSSRVLSQFISNVIHKKPIQLVNGGTQKRCFTYIDDGIDGMMRIIENKNNVADGKIFNLGSPVNNHSIHELATMVVEGMKQYPKYAEAAQQTQIIDTTPDDYYGKGYQDVSTRIPSIENAKHQLGWAPTTDMQSIIKKTLDYYFE